MCSGSPAMGRTKEEDDMDVTKLGESGRCSAQDSSHSTRKREGGQNGIKG